MSPNERELQNEIDPRRARRHHTFEASKGYQNHVANFGDSVTCIHCRMFMRHLPTCPRAQPEDMIVEPRDPSTLTRFSGFNDQEVFDLHEALEYYYEPSDDIELMKKELTRERGIRRDMLERHRDRVKLLTHMPPN